LDINAPKKGHGLDDENEQRDAMWVKSEEHNRLVTCPKHVMESPSAEDDEDDVRGR
jgi:hypothetical protein